MIICSSFLRNNERKSSRDTMATSRIPFWNTVYAFVFFSSTVYVVHCQEGQDASVKRPIIGKECAVDILFVLDASGSVATDFTYMRNFVADLAKTLTVSSAGHRVALLEYSGPSITWPRYPFGFASDTEAFVRFITKLPFLRGTTSTGKALNIALDMLKGRRPDVVTLVVVVTDGYSSDEVEEVSAQIRSMDNVILFAAGVTQFINKQTLLQISGDEGHLWTNPNVEKRSENSLREYLTCIIGPKVIPTQRVTTGTTKLTTSTTTVAGTTNPPTTTTTVASTTTALATGCEIDVLLVLDFSSSGSQVYTAYSNMAAKLCDQLRIARYYTRIAAIRYSSYFRTISLFHFRDYEDKEQVSKALQSIEFVGGTTNTSAGLELARDEFSVENGGRPGRARQVVVVFTDGFSQVDPVHSAKQLRDAGVVVYAVSAAEEGDENSANLEELESIAGDKSRVYNAETFQDLIKVLSADSHKCRR